MPEPARQSRGRVLPTERVKLPPFRWVLAGGLAVLAVLWIGPLLIEALQSADISGVARPYLLIFCFVAWDAVVPIFPSESLLTTASIGAAQGSNELEVVLVAIVGSLGAVAGDSLLYWIARTTGSKSSWLQGKIEQIEGDERVQPALRVMGSTAPLLITVGRFVPGLRFLVAATMGLRRYPYPRFLLFSAIGGTAWAFYTCVFSYNIGQSLDGYPVLSIAVSVVVTTALLALLYLPLKRRYEAETAVEDDAAEAPQTT